MIHVLGGAGFLGSKLSLAFSNAQIAHRIYDKASSQPNHVDVADSNSLRALPKATTVVNLAAEHADNVKPESLYHVVNVEGARNVCNYCREKDVRRIIFTSSVAVYGSVPETADETYDAKPSNEYGITKLHAENVYKEWFAEAPKDRTLIIIRPTVIFGENNKGNVFNLLRQIARRRFVMFGSGENKKSIAYVDNVADFIVHCLSFGTGEFVYNYSDSPSLSMNELVSFARKTLFGKEGIGIRVPSLVGLTAGYAADFITEVTGKELPVSSVRAKKFLASSNFEPTYLETGFIPAHKIHDALERTIRHEFMGTHE